MMEDIKKECQVYEKAFIVIADFIIALLIIRIFWVYRETQVAGLDLVDRIVESFVYVFALIIAVTVNVLLHKRISDEIWKLDLEYLCDKNKALFPSVKVIEEDMKKCCQVFAKKIKKYLHCDNKCVILLGLFIRRCTKHYGNFKSNRNYSLCINLYSFNHSCTYAGRKAVRSWRISRSIRFILEQE